MQLVIWVVVCPRHVVRSCFSEILYTTTLAHSAPREAVADTAAVGVVDDPRPLGGAQHAIHTYGATYKAPESVGCAHEATDTRQHERH